jgi:hypothetical protein
MAVQHTEQQFARIISALLVSTMRAIWIDGLRKTLTATNIKVCGSAARTEVALTHPPDHDNDRNHESEAYILRIISHITNPEL